MGEVWATDLNMGFIGALTPRSWLGAPKSMEIRTRREQITGPWGRLPGKSRGGRKLGSQGFGGLSTRVQLSL